MISVFPNDRDYFYDVHQNIYQVLGYMHPPDGVHCLFKYRKLENNREKTAGFVWKSQLSNFLYERNFSTYSSKTASSSIKKNPFRRFSEFYGVDFTIVPKEIIHRYLDPKMKLQQLRNNVRSNFSSLTDQERYAIELSYIFEDELGISSQEMGVTGSILWGGVHAESDIDMTFYGKRSFRAFLGNIGKLIYKSNQLRSPSLTEKMTMANKFSQKSGMSLDDCTVFIAQKKFLLYFSKYYLSIAFCPTPSEIQQNSLGMNTTRFTNIPELSNLTIQATVSDDDWMYYYPGIVYLKNVKIPHSPSIAVDIPPICRVLVFEHENIGYFEKGSDIEVRGLVQLIMNPPYDVIAKNPPINGQNRYAQLVVGTLENFGNEYIKKIGL